MENKLVSEKSILKAFEDWKRSLYEDKKITPKKFAHMQQAIYGCKCLINDLFESPRKKEVALEK